jgi:hypothetical protein
MHRTNEKAKEILIEIAKIGRSKSPSLVLNNLQPFKHFFNRDGNLIKEELDSLDGPWSRRELIARYLLLNAVLDQGPDMEGVRLLLNKVINYLYQREIRILHRPLDFFKEIGISIDAILSSHDSVKKIRSALWARNNNSNPDRYNLFMDNSKQALNYAIFRWGVPLAVSLLLEKNNDTLTGYLEKNPSSEIMSRKLKDDPKYGLGKAIGNKAAHLFTKWYVHSFSLSMNKSNSWGKLSFELPLDSNAGRVLFRTGWLLNFMTLRELKNWEVVQEEAGKKRSHYIRVTNLRGYNCKIAMNDSDFFNKYKGISREYLKIKANPRSVEIQQIPNALLLGTGYGIGDLDDGLMYIGTNVCFNLEAPKCSKCSINNLCEGYNKKHSLIKNYST